ncbi:hypothetical protein [Chitinophaga arvensicola]|uniref:Uncharacterized protein n=1 Tax=Chitinophaga arvensicola TaxID=29529 RepID=A0A1I0NA88_9BACT|nr:hypothetical protein [Chitinophaga arvensicola]SEV97795.1 hypothetical protein SAMN04488122_0038 [Chitinophaga arvensicola]
MEILTPDHLSDHSIVVKSDIFPVDKTWIDSIGLKLKVIDKVSGRDSFRIRYSGLRYSDGFLGPDGKIPLVVYATMDDGKEILIYDERIHGYEPILVEKKDFHAPRFQQYIDHSGAQLFRIYFCANSSIDFEDEFTSDENGLIHTLEDKYRSQEWLRANAFDYIVVFLENENGDFTKLIEMELA